MHSGTLSEGTELGDVDNFKYVVEAVELASNR
jgi:hypothetical protein